MQKYPEAAERPELVFIKKKQERLKIIELAIICVEIKPCGEMSVLMNNMEAKGKDGPGQT